MYEQTLLFKYGQEGYRAFTTPVLVTTNNGAILAICEGRNSDPTVMGGDSAAKTLTQIKLAKMGDVDEKTKSELYAEIKKRYDIQSDPRYAAARIWIDEIIDPRETRNVLIRSLQIVAHQTRMPEPKFGVLQV